MQKKVIQSFLLPAILLFFVFCSKLDHSTGVGAEIVEAIDPALMNFEKNFFALSADSSMVSQSSSLPATKLSGFGYHFGRLAAGKKDNSSVYGFTEFTVTKAFVKKFDAAAMLDSIKFVYDTILDTLRDSVISATTRFRLFSTDTSEYYRLSPPADTGTALGTIQQSSATGSHFVSRADSTFADSIFNIYTSYNRRMADTIGRSAEEKDTLQHRTDTWFNDTLYKRLFLSLFSTGDDLIWFKVSPAMVIHTHRIESVSGKDTLIAKTDSLRGISSLVATEDDSLIATAAPQPFSTSLSKRTAVFKLDLASLWDTMASTGFDEILSAAVTLTMKSLTIDTVPGDTSRILYFLSDKFDADSGEALDREFDAYASAYGSKSRITLLRLVDDTLVLPVGHHLQNYLDKKSDDPYYLYVRLKSNAVYRNQKILWDTPSFKAVLSTIN